MSKRMAPADRKASILNAAVGAARKHGYSDFRLTHVAETAECSTALVMIYYKTMKDVRRAVMGEAIRLGHLDIIATGIALRDPRCRKLTPELHQRALATLTR